VIHVNLMVFVTPRPRFHIFCECSVTIETLLFWPTLEAVAVSIKHGLATTTFAFFGLVHISRLPFELPRVSGRIQEDHQQNIRLEESTGRGVRREPDTLRL
jgi:hypothetical protein